MESYEFQCFSWLYKSGEHKYLEIPVYRLDIILQV